MPDSVDFQAIYQKHSEEYDRMVSAEDCDGNLLPSLQRLVNLQGARVVEVGVGTGRITRMLLAAGVGSLVGVDSSEAMLSVARRRLTEDELARTVLSKGDAARLPAQEGSADLSVAGWTFGHTTQWEPEAWKARIAAYVEELERVTRPGGVQVILETLGTGSPSAAAPSPALAAYYRYLESECGFAREVVATDYLFASPEEAADACGFFFGARFAALVVRNRWSRIPEWTGLWSRTRVRGRQLPPASRTER